MKELKENSVGTPLPGCPTALPSIADTSGEVSLQEYLSLIVVGLAVIIARGVAPHPRVAYPAPSGKIHLLAMTDFFDTLKPSTARWRAFLFYLTLIQIMYRSSEE